MFHLTFQERMHYNFFYTINKIRFKQFLLFLQLNDLTKGVPLQLNALCHSLYMCIPCSILASDFLKRNECINISIKILKGKEYQPIGTYIHILYLIPVQSTLIPNAEKCPYMFSCVPKLLPLTKPLMYFCILFSYDNKFISYLFLSLIVFLVKINFL